MKKQYYEVQEVNGCCFAEDFETVAEAEAAINVWPRGGEFNVCKWVSGIGWEFIKTVNKTDCLNESITMKRHDAMDVVIKRRHEYYTSSGGCEQVPAGKSRSQARQDAHQHGRAIQKNELREEVDNVLIQRAEARCSSQPDPHPAFDLDDFFKS